MVAEDHPRESGKTIDSSILQVLLEREKEREEAEKENEKEEEEKKNPRARENYSKFLTHLSSLFLHSFFLSFFFRTANILRSRSRVRDPACSSPCPRARREADARIEGDRLQFSILNSGKVIKQRKRGRGREREREPAREARARDAASSEGGRRLARRPRVRWRQAAFSHSLTETRS